MRHHVAAGAVTVVTGEAERVAAGVIGAAAAGGGVAQQVARGRILLGCSVTPGKEGLRYAEAASRLGVSEGAVKSMIHRLRQRHGELVREEIAHTVSSPTEVDDEIRYLRMVLGVP